MTRIPVQTELHTLFPKPEVNGDPVARLGDRPHLQLHDYLDRDPRSWDRGRAEGEQIRFPALKGHADLSSYSFLLLAKFVELLLCFRDFVLSLMNACNFRKHPLVPLHS